MNCPFKLGIQCVIFVQVIHGLDELVSYYSSTGLQHSLAGQSIFSTGLQHSLAGQLYSHQITHNHKLYTVQHVMCAHMFTFHQSFHLAKFGLLQHTYTNIVRLCSWRTCPGRYTPTWYREPTAQVSSTETLLPRYTVQIHSTVQRTYCTGICYTGMASRQIQAISFHLIAMINQLM